MAPLQQFAIQLFGKPGIGNAIAVNLMLPAAAVVMAACFPKLRTAAASGILVVLGFTLARMMHFDLRPWAWNMEFVKSHTSPILVGAAIGCSVLAVIAALIAGNFRRVGAPPHSPSCAACRHALAAHAEAPVPSHCPECGIRLK
ncbi:MAG: hypothetical protein K8R92_06455 [Planctomycetes bacterium]|nr:hypothetical protein [Planctomycetota bacterium]